MSNSIVNLASDSKCETSFASTMGTSPNSHLTALNHSHLELKVIPLFDKSNSARGFRDSLEGETSSSDLLEVLLSNVSSEVNLVKIIMALHSYPRRKYKLISRERNMIKVLSNFF